MARQPVFAIPLNRDSSTSLQDQLSAGLKERIRSGIIASGTSLPSTRELANDLGVSRNTVVNAYDRLLGEGYLESRARSGVFVNPALNQTTKHRLSTSRPSRSRRLMSPPEPETRLTEPRPFRPCQPDVRLFPLSQWNSMRTRILRSSGHLLFNYQSRFALGLPTLRQALATYLNESRGVRCNWQQIAITCGSQQALFLLSKLLLKPGDRVLLEDPGYVGARQAFELAGANIESLPVDEHGLVPPAKPVTASLIYSTPSRQFPTGATLPVSRRMQLLELMRQSKTWLLEDDYDSEFRYSRPPMPSLHSLDSTGRVIYLGSMSKVLFPSLRIGYVVLPEELITPFESLRLIVEDHGPLIDQATLADFIDSGQFYSHIRRCRKAYGSRLDAFLSAMQRHKIPLRFPNTDGGMNQAGYFEDRTTNVNAMVTQLQEKGFDVPSFAQYSLSKHVPGLVFGFTAFEPKTIQSVIGRMAPVLRQDE